MALEVAIARESGLQSGPWLRNQRWDLTFIILSISLVAVPLIMFYHLGVPVLYVNLLVALVVGGPHMYSTYTVSFLEPNFRRRYPVYAGIAFLIPIAVIYLAVANLTLLLTVFFFWASVHVLHQISFFVDCYRAKGGHPEPLWSRLVDYGVVFTCLYPIATYKLVRGEFIVENRPMLIPEIFRTDLLVWLAATAFGVVLFLFIARTVKEVRERRVNVPKTLLISLTAVVSFFVPAIENIEVAFQGMNTWHSFQYLALIWYMNALRKQRGQIGNNLVQKNFRRGKKSILLRIQHGRNRGGRRVSRRDRAAHRRLWRLRSVEVGAGLLHGRLVIPACPLLHRPLLVHQSRFNRQAGCCPESRNSRRLTPAQIRSAVLYTPLAAASFKNAWECCSRPSSPEEGPALPAARSPSQRLLTSSDASRLIRSFDQPEQWKPVIDDALAARGCEFEHAKVLVWQHADRLPVRSKASRHRGPSRQQMRRSSVPNSPVVRQGA